MILIYKKIKKHNDRKRLDTPQSVTASVDNNEISEPTTSVIPNEKKTISPEEAAEKKRRRTYRWKIILGLFAPFCLQSLDTTIIASALPYIAEDFGKQGE
jgi:hypothetical protein